MGNTSNEQEVLIGEIIIAGSEVAILPCQVPFQSKMQVIFQDALGRSVRTLNLELDERTNECDLDIQSLKPGPYHAWLYIGEKVFVRRFDIRPKDDGGVMGKLVSLFK